jgi:hypothetical protein
MPELFDPCGVDSGFGIGDPVVSLRSTTGYCLTSLRLAEWPTQDALGTGLGDGDRDGVLMNIETEMECNSLHGVVVLFAFT